MILFHKNFCNHNPKIMGEMREQGGAGKRSWRMKNNRYKFLRVSSGIHSSCLMIHVSLYPGVVAGQKQT